MLLAHHHHIVVAAACASVGVRSGPRIFEACLQLEVAVLLLQGRLVCRRSWWLLVIVLRRRLVLVLRVHIRSLVLKVP